MFFQVIKRELKIAFRQRAEIIHPLWFFLIVIMLFPLSLDPYSPVLVEMSHGIIWVAALLSCLLSLDRLFKDDLHDGSLEQLMLTTTPLPLIALAKVIAHWIITGLPLLILSPIAALLLSMSFHTWQVTELTLLIGTPILSLIGAIGVALTTGLQRGGILLSILILPLYIPILIFATSAIDAASMQLSIGGYFAILGAILIGAMVLAPFAIAVALRISIH